MAVCLKYALFSAELFNAVGGDIFQRLSGRSAIDLPVRRNFGQRDQDESALEQTRMRKHEVVRVDGQVVVGEQIEVERAGSKAPFVGAVAAVLALDCLQGLQQDVWIERGFDLDAGVDVGRLVLAAPGWCRIIRRTCD